MPAPLFEYKNGIFYINGARALFPMDEMHKPGSFIFGMNYATGDVVPASFTADGKLNVGGVSGIVVEIGKVAINDGVNDAILTTVAKDQTNFAVFVQSDSLAKDTMYQQNITSIYTYVAAGLGIGKVQTIKEYPTGAAGGAPAKLTTYTYDGSNRVASIVVTNTTV